MLAYILAIAIGLSSLLLLGIAFFASTLHRKDDFLWSGVGLFYALVLWFCANQIRGAVLLGNSAAAILVLSFGWQTLQLRRAIAYPEQQGEMFSLMTWIQNRLNSLLKKKKAVSPTPSTEQITETATEPVTEPPAVELSSETPQETETEATETITTPSETETEAVVTDNSEQETETVREETVPEEPTAPEKSTETSVKVPKTQIKPKKGFSFPNLFGFGKNKNKPTSTPEQITQALEEAETSKDDLEEDWETPEVIKEVSSVSVAKIAVTEVNQEVAEVVVETSEEIHETVTKETEPGASSSLENPTQESSDTIETTETTNNASFISSDEPELTEEDLIVDDEAETVIEAYRPNISKWKSETIVTEISPVNESTKVDSSLAENSEQIAELETPELELKQESDIGTEIVSESEITPKQSEKLDNTAEKD